MEYLVERTLSDSFDLYFFDPLAGYVGQSLSWAQRFDKNFKFPRPCTENWLQLPDCLLDVLLVASFDKLKNCPRVFAGEHCGNLECLLRGRVTVSRHYFSDDSNEGCSIKSCSPEVALHMAFPTA